MDFITQCYTAKDADRRLCVCVSMKIKFNRDIVLGKSWNSIKIEVKEDAQEKGTKATLNSIIRRISSNWLAI